MKINKNISFIIPISPQKINISPKQIYNQQLDCIEVMFTINISPKQIYNQQLD